MLQDILECARPELFSLSKRGIGNSCMTIGNVTAKLHSLSGKLWSPIFPSKLLVRCLKFLHGWLVLQSTLSDM